MKYKIGDSEFDAVQWNDTDCSSSEIYNLAELCGKNVDIEKINIGGYDYFKLKVEVSDTRFFLYKGDYLVKSETSLFRLSEQDFNKIATKVKEPKFKVGDKVYLAWPEVITVNKVVAITWSGWYKLDDDNRYKESKLLTLEEAIDKLKEL